MAQTNYTPISLYYSSTSGHVPTAGNLVNGELAINIADGILFYKNASGVVTPFASGGAPATTDFTAGAGQTTFTLSYTVGNLEVYRNGVKLGIADFTATNGTSFTLATGAAAGDLIEAVTFTGTVTPGGVTSISVGSGMTASGSTGAVTLGLGSLGNNRVWYGNSTGVASTSANLTFDGTNLGTVNDAYIHTLTVGLGGGNVATNTTFGYQALTTNSTGANNTAVGYQAGYSNTTGASNVSIGNQAGYASTTGAGNTFVGGTAGQNTTATGITGNTFIGNNAGLLNTSGVGNTYVGAYSPSTNSGSGQNMTTGSYNTILGAFGGNQNGLDIRTASNYIVLSDGAGNPRGIFNGSGDFFIGNTGTQSGSPTDPTGSTLAASGATVFVRNSAFATMVVNNLSSGASVPLINFANAGSNVGGIFSNGTTTTYATSSDYRLKEDVQPMQDALATVAQLNPVTYKWKVNGSDGQGFIAHELQAVVPECVTGEKDAVDEEGNPVYQGIDTSFLVATLTKAIQEQQAIITQQAADIAALKAKVGI